MSMHRIACPWCEEDSALEGGQFEPGLSYCEVMVCQRCEGVSVMVIHAAEGDDGRTELYISIFPPVGVSVDEVEERARHHGFELNQEQLQKVQRMLDIAGGLFRFRAGAASAASRN